MKMPLSFYGYVVLYLVIALCGFIYQEEIGRKKTKKKDKKKKKDGHKDSDSDEEKRLLH